MRSPTLTPDAEAYVVAVVVVWSVSSGTVAGALKQRRFARGGPAFLTLHAGLMVAVLALALGALDLPAITAPDGLSLLLAAPAGFLAMLVAVAAETRLQRRLRRRRLHGRARRYAAPAVAGGRAPIAHGTQGLALLVLVGALEELLYRGVLVDLALRLPTGFAILALGASVLAFALGHLPLGWDQVLGKLPLSAAALSAALALGGVLPAVVAHVLYNVRAWRIARAAAP